MVWIVIVVCIVVAAAVYAFWPHKTGITDKNIVQARRRGAGRNYWSH
ncbi:hypothetical protein JCM18899A_14120 [Nocardioides sp. AN3]